MPGPQGLGDDGKAIVEFALVGPIFLAITLSIFEFSGIMFVQTLLEGGAREASRYGPTGQQPEGVIRDDMILQIINENSFGIIDVNEPEIDDPGVRELRRGGTTRAVH